MDELTEILEAVDAGDLSGLTDEQLAEAAEKIKEFGKSLKSDKPSDQDIEDAKALKAAYESVQAELGKRSEAAEARAKEAAEAFSAFDEEEEEKAEEEPATEPEPEPVQAAARPSAAEVAKRRPPSAEPKPEPAKALVASVVEGGGDGNMGKLGMRFDNVQDLAQAMVTANGRFSDGIRAVAQIPREHKYQVGPDAIGNARTLREVAEKSQAARQEGVAITAALGCAPAEPVYDFFQISARGAGLVDLPSVTARRGARIYPPSVGQTDLAGQTGIGSEYTGASKTCYTVNCGTDREFEVIANWTCLTFTNEHGQFYPELVDHYLAEAVIAAEHRVNQRLIENIRDSDQTTPVQDLDTLGGTVVGLIRAVARTRAYYIERHRMSEGAVLDAIFPHWFAAAYAADIAARQSTDFGQAVNLGLARIAADLRQVGVNAQFVYDWQDPVAEGFDDFGSFLLFAPGTVVRLDGPVLDLGIVRDSTLNAANTFQTFVESWVGLAVPGHQILYVQGVETCPSGATGQTAALTCGAS